MPSIPWLNPARLEFPDPALALQSPNGLLAVGGDLAPERIIHAYRHGIFPWYQDPQPILWWSPDPRAVIFPASIHISRSLRKVLRANRFAYTTDTAFNRVIHSCADMRADREGTWLTEEMIAAYTELYEMGLAHSVEVWRDGQLLGGLYGLALGRVFYGESMFSLKPNASKVALVMLASITQRLGCHMIDCQVESEHLLSMGAVGVPRGEFLGLLARYAKPPDSPGRWPFATPQPTDSLVKS